MTKDQSCSENETQNEEIDIASSICKSEGRIGIDFSLHDSQFIVAQIDPDIVSCSEDIHEGFSFYICSYLISIIC